MKATTKATILALANDGFTFYAPVSSALNIKGTTAEKYLRQLVQAGLLVAKDDGVHAVRYETSPLGRRDVEQAEAWDRLAIS